jgi:hypothetical protein
MVSVDGYSFKDVPVGSSLKFLARHQYKSGENDSAIYKEKIGVLKSVINLNLF